MELGVKPRSPAALFSSPSLHFPVLRKEVWNAKGTRKQRLSPAE